MTDIGQSIPALATFILLAASSVILLSFAVASAARAYTKMRWRKIMREENRLPTDDEIMEQMYG